MKSIQIILVLLLIIPLIQAQPLEIQKVNNKISIFNTDDKIHQYKIDNQFQYNRKIYPQEQIIFEPNTTIIYNNVIIYSPNANPQPTLNKTTTTLIKDKETISYLSSSMKAGMIGAILLTIGAIITTLLILYHKV